ncbi:ExbD/TolR family protein [Limnoglobus roseus]|uniref:Biopolymer transporter ExbD n=1 Tax=Limnoglobus roseus TaxID=2598579 RepID=A0A5C1ACX0_9BACT|nr:biopolymer transporter ExbD [Limnoglobus roseus]QEL17199.1 biopolymer transporter ExbD [Limnoglobus roseus]
MAVVSFDIWLLSSNTVYRGVPFGVVTDWAQQGRLSADDKAKEAGPGENWVRVADHPIVGDYLFVKTADAPVVPAKATEALEPVEMDVGWRKSHDDGDDDPDLIPLIDISLVLLIFFMMTATVASMSPFPNPEMANAANLSDDPGALLIEIDKNVNGEAAYSLRVGTAGPEPGASDLKTLPELVRVMDAKLSEILSRGGKAPPVHVACHKELNSERILELASELEKRKRENKISMFGSVVNERSK